MDVTKFWSEHFPDILALPSGKHAVSLSASSGPCDRRQAPAKPAHPHQHVQPDASGTKPPMTPRPLTRPFTAEALLGLRGAGDGAAGDGEADDAERRAAGGAPPDHTHPKSGMIVAAQLWQQIVALRDKHQRHKPAEHPTCPDSMCNASVPPHQPSTPRTARRRQPSTPRAPARRAMTAPSQIEPASSLTSRLDGDHRLVAQGLITGHHMPLSPRTRRVPEVGVQDAGLAAELAALAEATDPTRDQPSTAAMTTTAALLQLHPVVGSGSVASSPCGATGRPQRGARPPAVAVPPLVIEAMPFLDDPVGDLCRDIIGGMLHKVCGGHIYLCMYTYIFIVCVYK